VYVVRDDLMPRQNAAGTAAPRYGEEVPRQGWQAALDSLVRAVQMHQMNNPLYIPFKPGTPTVEQQKVDWLKQKEKAGLTGYYQGKPTWEREYYTRQQNLERQKLQQQGKAEKNAKEEASEYISKNLRLFKRPIDFLMQARRNMEAGELDPEVYAEIQKQITESYHPYETLSTWGR
ncbi:hypothetical protein, partial [Desulfofundulus sp.]|uniref:hypothetical protein n=1 Tax=Desulfofundulus sp. TaxID=2282750 RepID=UPI003C726B98